MTVAAEDGFCPIVAEAFFDQFYSAHYAPVVRMAIALTGRPDVAEELTQEAFLSAYRRWSRVGALDDPGGWVRRVTINRCVSSGRRYVTELRLLSRLRQERPTKRLDESVDEELWSLVRALPRRQAQVLALAFVEDRSVVDIAAILGCGEATVRTHLRRGRAELARRLASDGVDADKEDDRG